MIAGTQSHAHWRIRAQAHMTSEAYVWIAAGLGLILASFIGLVSLRWPQDRPIALSRSTCAGCGRQLGVLDLVPILSFLALRGRCRACAAPIPRRYLALELACPALAFWAGSVREGPEILFGAGLAWALLLLAILDFEHFWLPDEVTLPLAGAGLFAAWYIPHAPSLLEAMIGCAIGFGFFWGLAFAYRRLRGREGLGGGDARLLAAAGAWVGWIGLPSVLLWASLSGLSLVCARLLMGRTIRAEDRIPFGIFLALGLWLTWAYGPLGL